MTTTTLAETNKAMRHGDLDALTPAGLDPGTIIRTEIADRLKRWDDLAGWFDQIRKHADHAIATTGTIGQSWARMVRPDRPDAFRALAAIGRLDADGWTELTQTAIVLAGHADIDGHTLATAWIATR